MARNKDAITDNQIPRFETKRPNGVQKWVLKFAGALLRVPNPADPEEVFRRFAQEVGGFQPNRQDQAGVDPTRFSHADAQMVTRFLLGDETTEGGPVRRPSTIRDHEDARGLTTMESAVARTLNGQRQPETLNTRGKLARGAVRFALRRTTISGHTVDKPSA